MAIAGQQICSHDSLPHIAATIGIHNFPEGIATFIVGLATPRLGIALAIAIAVHNIPEGKFLHCYHFV